MNAFQPLQLPNGTQIPNRIAKAAMEENLAALDQGPSAELLRLYQAWAEGGAGLLLTGNVMIDRRAMTGPGGVVLEDDRLLQRFRDWARIGRAQGAQFWMQLNHPGRQMQANLGQPTVAPSAVALELGSFSKMFPLPRPLSDEEIGELIQRFARSAALAEQAGFTGVQIHAAHGYLLSQFLSPLSNQRTDSWGGPIENRARLLLEVVKAVRAQVAPGFCVAVKLNSADFQRGGFDASDAKRVVQMLNELDVDLVELSGGSYEAPAMQGDARDGRTLAREAYFLEFAGEIAQVARMPVMVTGGIRRLPVVQQVLDSGLAMAGIATALAIEPALPRQWQAGQNSTAELPPIRWKRKALASLAYMAAVKYQLRRLSQGRRPNPGVSPLRALLAEQLKTARRARQYRHLMASA
ncbi:NADH:flavin oxidoreductase/NADH oxidase family protein [Aquipseudomonas alcaligenes]|uniref:FMN oxidoreductase n=1 Tax=Aquipseudomonas alcaligenes TaxID=43263 RepID=A0AA37FK59_AQUAC|nr:NADH:flavin oxidoreductase/NADH oxidase family protein [Pseudomonas alcaligenes]BCR23748.1 FMN oxidoreductase [Pseudomonas alcaligenes]GIZ65199.1 FMN oxidoreductase [Pseudomonas alcaligenes]GIZ69476.1 FMN oxidoreductase [Pseudomonas alcaligenes]GIZ73828.1 FMN oxidoreductase [Pseudomonas alcaligenes]GIZ78189.1 FMN oxidoreductase [Pseudomonas alcaligenes]